MNPITKKIKSFLRAIEEERGVRILYACESGSRAWGFPSADSDYDVRFVYVQPVEHYLSMKKRGDVIEYPVRENLDINGWDLQKALLLLRKSNPPLVEWLGSPIIYLEEYSIAAQMRDLAARYYSAAASAYHYLHMARGNYREYLKGERVWLKKYFYVLRPILAVKWIEEGKRIVPTEFNKLVNGLVTDPVLKKEIAALVQKKRRGEELDDGPRIAPINEFIEQALAHFDDVHIDHEKHFAPIEELNSIFFLALKELWGYG
jgi:uncharacterized protein